jgi:small subunit ribosomal protein S3
LGGAEIARREVYKEGSIPLHTLRALIDYGFAEAKTTYGLIGVKVWIFRGQELTSYGEVAQPKENASKENAPSEGVHEEPSQVKEATHAPDA